MLSNTTPHATLIRTLQPDLLLAVLPSNPAAPFSPRPTSPRLVAAVGALAPGPGRPGLDARARAALLVLLRRLRADGRDSQGVGRVLPLARLSQVSVVMPASPMALK